MSRLTVEAGGQRPSRSRNEEASYLAIGVAFALGGVWTVLNRPAHWTWIAFAFALTGISQAAIALARPRLGTLGSAALGLGVFVLVAATFWLAAWPIGTGDMWSFFFGFGAGNFLAAALRAHLERDGQ